MEKYSEYKDSGVQWLGEIPSHWSQITLKRIFKERVSGSWGEDENVGSQNSVCLRIADFNYSQLRFAHKQEYTVRSYTEKEIQQKHLNKGELLIEKSGGGDKWPVGRMVIYDLDIPSPMYANFMEKLIVRDFANPYYINYLMAAFYNNGMIWPYVKATTGIQNLDITNLLSKEYTYLPPLNEQQAIADYLDATTAKIDEAIAQQQKMIDLLTERKQIIINNAVTKGLNPSAPMKDSGVDWIGEIPEHWEVKQYRHLFYNLDYLRQPITADQRSRNNPLYDYYGASGVIDKIDYYNVEDKVLLIGEDGANLLMRNLPLIYKAEGRFWVNNHAHILKPKNDDYDFMAYVMEAADYTLYITGSAQPKLSQANLNSVKLPIPPLAEQLPIVEYLNNRVGKIDVAIQNAEKQISLLQERKQIIINEVVTGKVKVS